MNAETTKHGFSVRHADGVLTMTRFFRAPRELVFETWTKPQHFAQWFGPAGGSVPHCTIDARPGGIMHFGVQVPENEGPFSGATVWAKWIFREVAAPERIVFEDYFADEDGNIVEHPGFPRQTLISIFFEECDGGTLMTLRQEGLEVDHGETEGWREGFERLDGLLEKLATA